MNNMDHNQNLDNAASMNAQSSLSAAKICLRVCGITGCGSRGGEVLDLLRKLEPRLHALRDTFPNLGNTIDMMLSVAKIKSGRARTLEIAPKYELVSYGIVNFVRWILYDQNSPLHELPETIQETELLYDVVALRWLQSTAIRCFGDQAKDTFWLTADTPQSNYKEIQTAYQISDSLSQIDGDAKVRLAAWISIIEAAKGLDLDEEVKTKYALARILVRLKAIKEIGFVCHKYYRKKELPRLTERQLRTSNWYFPRPNELKKIQKFLEIVPNFFLESSTRYEAVLISLSAITCRPIQEIVEWPVVETIDANCGKNRFFVTSIVDINSDGHDHMVSNVYWVRAEHGIDGAVAMVPIRFAGGNWLNLWHPNLGRQSLHQLLPFSGISWDRRAYSLLAKEIGCTPQRAELITRDLLPRVLYKTTANSALVDFWRSDSSKQMKRSTRLALSHYLQPSGNRVSNTYRSTVGSTIGTLGGQPIIEIQLGLKPLTQSESKSIFKALKNNRNKAKNTIEKHNAIALQTMYVNIFSTGHRSSTAPFPFPWDFSPSENLVFVCDKLVTGSEARFLPLTPSAQRLTAEYSSHLKYISNDPDICLEAKHYAENIYKLLGFENKEFLTSFPHSFIPHSGVFFLLSSDGELVSKPISTRFLDQFIEEKTGIQRSIRRVRTTMAQYLWEEGCSGRAVQAFLGHQPEMHAHGPGSTWSVLSLADLLSPKIELYFVKVLGLPKCAEQVWRPSQHFPYIAAAPHDPDNNVYAPGYEGREREHEWAVQRARAIVRRELSEYFMAAMANGGGDTNGQERQFTAEDRKRLDKRVRSELGDDAIALRKVNSVLQGQLDRLTSGSLWIDEKNFRISAPGPIDIGFSRLLRCALVLRSIWEKSVGKSIVNPTYDPLERLAQLAISLICFDGVLAEENLEGLVMAASRGEFEAYRDQMTLRCRVVTNTHDYEFCSQLGQISAALVLGCSSHSKTFAAEWADIKLRIIANLKKIALIGPGNKWSVSRLCMVFRPYWLIRMSGAMYSVAIGEHKGPAPDARSNAQLHGLDLPSELSFKADGKILLKSLKSEQELAIAALKKIFSNARGVLERGEQRKMPHRSRLQNGLSSKEANEALHYGRSTQIVPLLLSFIGKLLDTGGPRKVQLAPSSIQSYFSSIVTEFIYQAWDFDFESASSETLQELFNLVSVKVNPKNRELVLRLFSHHLRDEIAIPYFGSQWFSPREPVRIRSSLVLPEHLTQAIVNLNRKNNQTARHAANFLAISHAYGLRKLETFGLSADRFDEIQPFHLTVGRTPIADLKTQSARRVIPASISKPSTGQHILNAVTLARTSGRPLGFIFESATTDNKIEQVGPITAMATEAIRQSTGTAAVVAHTLRHSFATILGLALYADEGLFPNDLKALKVSLLGNLRTRVGQILQSPDDWPFGVDAIATLLGHVDSSTFLNVYFHGSHLLINSHCQRWQPKDITQAQVANMLDKERSALSKLKKKLRTGSVRPGELQFVTELVAREGPHITGVHHAAQEADSQSSEPRRWELFLRALQLRQEQDLTLDAMKLYAIDGLGMSQDTVEKMAGAYIRLVSETAMDDFEPASSHLVNPTVSHQVGISRGANEREDFVARTQAWANSSSANATILRNLLENWHARVKSSKPVIVCQSAADFDVTIAALTDLGAKPQQLDIRLHGDLPELWRDAVLAGYPDSTISSVRASRGSTKVKVTEVSITVRQTLGSLIPDGRDLHRAMLGLYIGLHALGMDD